MRIIDQEGRFDLPYDNIILTVDDGSIFAVTHDGSEYLLALYVTDAEEKIRRELKRLHDAYDLMNTAVFRFRSDKDA